LTHVLPYNPSEYFGQVKGVLLSPTSLSSENKASVPQLQHNTTSQIAVQSVTKLREQVTKL